MNKRWFILLGVLFISTLMVRSALAAARHRAEAEIQAPMSAPSQQRAAEPAHTLAPAAMEYVTEDFNGAFPPTGWTVVNHGGDCVWGDDADESSPEGNLTAGFEGFADADSDNCGGEMTMDTSLVSPMFDLSMASGSVFLEFSSDYRHLGNQVGAVEIINTGIATWTRILTVTTACENARYHIDLTSYVGYADTRIRFRFIAPEQDYWWQIDDVVVAEALPDLDVSHDIPAVVPSGQTIPYTLTVHNIGTMPANNVLVSNPVPSGTSYVAGSLSCTGTPGTCTYNTGNQSIEWSGTLTSSSDLVHISFWLSPTTNDLCAHVENLALVDESTSGLHIEDRMGTDIVPEVYTYTDFEADSGGFTSSGEWQWGTPNIDAVPRGPGKAFDGNKLWGTSLSAAYAGGGVLSRTLDLRSISPTPTGVWLQWGQWLDLLPGDNAIVKLGQDTFEQHREWYPERTWHVSALDITPYLGQVITLTFELDGHNSTMSRSGWYIDAVSIIDGCPHADIAWTQIAFACPGDTISYPIRAHNGTYSAQTFSLSTSGNAWLTSLSDNNFSVSPGEMRVLTATVQIPASASLGSYDEVLVENTTTPGGYHNMITLTTKVDAHWGWVAPAPVPAMDGAAIAVDNETFYFPGGLTNTFKYVSYVDDWEPLAAQPAPAYKGDACFGANAGGEPVIVLFPDPSASSPYLHIYNLSDDTWTLSPILGSSPFPLFGYEGMSVVSIPGTNRCYLSGGMSTTSAEDVFYAFDVASNTFTALSPMASPRAYHASWTTPDGRVCVGGGFDMGGNPLTSTQCYDPASTTWEAENTTFGHLPAALWGMAEAQPGPEDIFLMGGSTSLYINGVATEATPDTFRWDSTGLTWTMDAPLPIPVYRGAADVQGGEVYLIGGSHPVYNESSSEWTDYPSDDNLWRRSCEVSHDVDLWLQKYASPPVTVINTPFTYTFEIGNNGPAWASNVVLHDWLPSGITITLPEEPSCVLGGSGFTCTLGSIPPGSTARVDITATAYTSGTFINQAFAETPENDPRLSNNAAAVQSIVLRQPFSGPRIFDVFPPQGINISDTIITITGMNFQPGLSVTLDAIPIAYTYQTDDLIRAVVPAGMPPATYDVSVINPDGLDDTALRAFTVYADADPRVDAVFPDAGTNDIPVGLVVIGENFAPGATVILSQTVPGFQVQAGTLVTIPLEGNYFINGNQLLAFVPAGAVPGIYDVLVVNPDGRIGALQQAYRVIDATSTDLYGRRGDVWSIPATPRAGETITVGATVRRRGGLSTTLPGVDVAFFLGNPAAGGLLLDVGSTGPLPPRGFGIATVSVDLSSMPPGYYTIYAVIDSNDAVAEFDEENNVISHTLAVLPPAEDAEAPTIVGFRINDGAQRTTDVQVSLLLSATDNIAPAYVYFVEYTYLQVIGTWWPVQFGGWQPFDVVTPWALHPTPGAHYIQAWVADAAGNLGLPRYAWINLMQADTPISRHEVHPYRLRLHNGDSVLVRLTSGVGDADLYVFGPRGMLIGRSENGTPTDEVTFTATQNGIYQIEVEGYAANSIYTLEVLPGGTTLLLPTSSDMRVPQKPLRGRGSPILSVDETPPANTGLEEVPDTLHVIYLPLTFR